MTDIPNIGISDISILIILGIFGVLMLLILIKGLFIVQPEERAVIEFLGRFARVANPGVNFKIPFLEYIRVRIDAWEQQVPMYDQDDVKIDLVDGSVRPKSGKVFVAIRDPQKAIYEVDDWRSAIKVLAETLVSSYLHPFTIEEVLRQGRGRFDIAFQIDRRTKELRKEIKRQQDQGDQEQVQRLQKAKMDLESALAEIRKTRDSWGVEITQIFIPDYELDPSIIQAREEVHTAERRAAAAQHHTRQQAIEAGGLYAEIRKILIEVYGYQPDYAEGVAKELWAYFRGTEKGSIIDVRGESLASVLAQAVAAIERIKGTHQGHP